MENTMVNRILELTKYQTKDGTLFDNMDDACEYQNIQELLKEINDKGLCDVGVPDIVIWLLNKELLTKEVLAQRYEKKD